MKGNAKTTYLNSGCVLFDIHANEILSCTQVEVLEANIEQLQEHRHSYDWAEPGLGPVKNFTQLVGVVN